MRAACRPQGDRSWLEGRPVEWRVSDLASPDDCRELLRGAHTVVHCAAEVAAPAEQVRYGYAGGVTACMALDEMLADVCGRARPLDGILRDLYTRDRGRPLTHEGLQAAVLAATGVDCTAWLEAHVYGKVAPPAVMSML